MDCIRLLLEIVARPDALRTIRVEHDSRSGIRVVSAVGKCEIFDQFFLRLRVALGRNEHMHIQFCVGSLNQQDQARRIYCSGVETGRGIMLS